MVALWDGDCQSSHHEIEHKDLNSGWHQPGLAMIFAETGYLKNIGRLKLYNEHQVECSERDGHQRFNVANLLMGIRDGDS